jgi:Mycotoxin biosynthesis protein UstYa
MAESVSWGFIDILDYNVTESPHTIRLHISHCIDALRQVIQCHGDTSMVTYSWRPDYMYAYPWSLPL